MSNRVLRQQPRLSYYEPEEPSLDEYIFCDVCGDFVYEYCSLHGPLLVIPDDKVNRSGIPAIVPRAALTIPKMFLHLAPSVIPGAGLGVFATLTLPRGVRFGPYRGKKMPKPDSMYCWQIYDKNRKPSHVVDAVDSNTSNWMRYVNCARHWAEQNLVAYQYKGELYYRTIKTIPRFTELMVFYGSVFAKELEVDLAKYNSPNGYAQKFGAPPIKKRKINETKPNRQASKTSKETDSNNKTCNDNLPSNSVTKPEKIKEKQEKIKPTFGKNNRGKKDTAELSNDVKAKPVPKKTKKAPTKKNKENVKNTLPKTTLNDKVKTVENKTEIIAKNAQFNKAPKTAIRDKTEANKINSTNLNTVANTKLNSNTEFIDLYKYCEICNLKCLTKNDLDKHMRFHDNTRPHVCEVCSYRFNNLICLNNHKSTHSDSDVNKKFSCDKCDYKSKRKGDLKSHMKIHTKEKPFCCDKCHYRSTQISNLIKHMRIHTKEKPFSCDKRDYKFTDKSILIRHMRIHTQEKPYACDICVYKCTQKSSLITHMRIHTKEKPYACDICVYKFTVKSNLIRHIRIHTKEKPYACDICEFKTAYKNSLKQHLIKTHLNSKLL